LLWSLRDVVVQCSPAIILAIGDLHLVASWASSCAASRQIALAAQPEWPGWLLVGCVAVTY